MSRLTNRAWIAVALLLALAGGCGPKDNSIFHPDWQFRAIVTDEKMKGPSTFCLDADDMPHVIYAAGDAVKYARPLQGVWKTEPVAATERKIEKVIGLDAGIDKNGKLHALINVMFADTGETAIIHGVRVQGSAWKFNPVVQGGFGISMALDFKGNPCFSFISSDYKLKYARIQGAHCDVTEVDGDALFDGQKPSSAIRTSLAIDFLAHPHISYMNHKENALRYANDMGVGWTTQNVEVKEGLACSFTSIATDKSGNADIAYQSPEAGGIGFNYWTGKKWGFMEPDPDGAFSPDLKICRFNIPRLAYFKFGYRELRYAELKNDKWKAVVVEGRGLPKLMEKNPDNLTLRMDNKGRPCIVYCDPNKKAVIFLKQPKKSADD
jgi:hypothetical protein